MTWRFSRRRLIERALIGAAALVAAGARASGSPGEDRGIGGTGAAPGEDRGIGGTGVVGTIRRFGSIFVNDLRISYPAGVDVTIDGRTATAADLRLGQVVEVLASGRRGRLSTRHIVVTHEVVGPVEVVGPRHLEVMGQIVDLDPADEASAWREGDTVAVSGLRRPDGSIAASLVEPADPTVQSVTGVVEPGPDGTARIGGLVLAGRLGAVLGRRVSLRGQLLGGRFQVDGVAASAVALLSGQVRRLSLEAYVLRRGSALHIASGFDIGGAVQAPDVPEARAVPAIVTASLQPDGSLRLDSVRMEHGRHGRGSGRGRAGGGQGGMGPGRGQRSRGGGGGPSGSGPSGGGPSGSGPGGRTGPSPSGGGSDGDGPGRR